MVTVEITAALSEGRAVAKELAVYNPRRLHPTLTTSHPWSAKGDLWPRLLNEGAQSSTAA